MTFKERRIKELKEKIQTMQSELQTLQNELEKISKEDSSWVDLNAKLRDFDDFPEHNNINGFPYIVLAIMDATNKSCWCTGNITVEDLISCKKEDILRGKCIGQKRMEKLISWMEKHHLKFADETAEF